MSNGTATSNAGVEGPQGYLGGNDGFRGWFDTRDHKRIGMLFLCWTLGVFLLGALFAVIMKLRASSGLVDTPTYHKMLTQHGLLMVFFFVVPAIPSILGYFLLPLQLGAANLAVPRLSLCSLRIYAVGTLLFVMSIAVGAVSTGWTFMTPFALGGDGAFALLAVGLFFVALSWFMTGLNFIITVHYRRAEAMGFFDMPVLSWALYLTGYMLLAVGILFGIIVLYLASARTFGKGLFSTETDPLVWQNYFWFVTTPAAFFALLPAVGVISEVIAGISRKAVAGYRTLVGSMIALLAMSFVTWGVRLIGSGQDPATSFVFGALSILTVIPVALIVYSWLATLHRGSIACAAPTTFVVSFLLQAGIGAVMSLFLSSLAVGQYLANTLFVTAHSHYVMMGGVMTALLAGLHYWWPKLTGRRYHEGLGRFSAMLYTVGLNLAFFPQIIQGVRGVPRGVYELPAELAGLEIVSMTGVWILVTGIVVIASNLLGSLWDGARAVNNPWGATTLEWQAASPPPAENFATAPTVTGPYETIQ